MIFHLAFAFIRPFLHEHTVSKIQIFSHNDSEECRKALLNVIDADQLFACYGGTMTDADGNPHCTTKVFFVYFNCIRVKAIIIVIVLV